jgi:hypothetical protein
LSGVENPCLRDISPLKGLIGGEDDCSMNAEIMLGGHQRFKTSGYAIAELKTPLKSLE